MFVTVYIYQTKEGHEQAVEALHQGWCQRLRKTRGCLSCELFNNLDDPQEFIAITRFESEQDVWAAIETPEYHAWYGDLVRLVEAGPSVNHYRLARDNAPVVGQRQ